MPAHAEGTVAAPTADPRDGLPCGIAVADRAGLITYANAWLRERFGVEPVGRPFAELLTRPGRVYLNTHLRPLLHYNREADGVSLRLAADAGAVPVFVSARRDEAWNVDYVLYPAGERFNFERELVARRREAEELASLMLASPDAVYAVDADMHFVSWNPAAERLFGHAEDEVKGQPLVDFFSSGDGEDKRRSFARVVASTEPVVFETEHSAGDGTAIPVEVSAVATRDATGEVTGAICVARDVRSRRRTQAQLDALAEEVAHRSKNMLSVVQVIANQTRRHSREADFVETFERRLDSLVRNNALLVRERFEPVALHDLVRSQLEHLGAAADDERFDIRGPALRVRPKAAEAIAMALFELATNAAKYGALSVPGGRVALDWSLDGDVIVLRWCERGGPAAVEPAKSGFGSAVTGRILEASAGGTVERDYAPAGLTWRFAAPSTILAA